MSLALRYVAHSEIGLVRKNNQDSAYVSPTMLMVADGMGGAAAGDLASAVAVHQLALADAEHPTGEAMLPALGTALKKASEAIADLITNDPKLDGMGSTVCGVAFDGEKLALANIGDSRAYRYRDGKLTRLSRDHSWVQTLIDDGRLTEAEALEHPHRSLILRVVNGQPQQVPDLEWVDVAEGDRLLICSDGLCGMVTDQVIEARIVGDRADVMDALVRVAHLEGGQDNITIIVADVITGEPEGEPELLGAAARISLDAAGEPTLVGIDAEQAVPDPTTVGEVARYAPTRRRGTVWLKVVLGVLLPLLAVAGGTGLWYAYTQSQYFVGANNTTLGIFRGIPEPVFRLPLSTLVQTDDTLLTDLPPYYQEQVRKTVPANTLDAARATLVMLRDKAAECREQRKQYHQEPTPTPTAGLPTDSASPGHSASMKPTPSGSASAVHPTILFTPTPTPSVSTPSAPTEC
jgi:protein phosphatase